MGSWIASQTSLFELGILVVMTSLLLALGLGGARWFRARNPALSHKLLMAGVIGSLALPLVTVLSSLPSALRHQSWCIPVAGGWVVGFLAVVGRSAYGYFTLAALRRYGSVSVSRDDLDLGALARRAGYLGAWDLRECATREIAVPITWGVLRPTVMLPVDSERWPLGRLEAVLLHELAHVRRRDFASQAIADFASAVYWFNPLVWMSAAALRADAEAAADVAVLRSGIRPSDYAAELLQLAADLGRRHLPPRYRGTPVVPGSKIESRLRAVLAPEPKGIR